MLSVRFLVTSRLLVDKCEVSTVWGSAPQTPYRSRINYISMCPKNPTSFPFLSPFLTFGFFCFSPFALRTSFSSPHHSFSLLFSQVLPRASLAFPPSSLLLCCSL